jgi:signal transduction histidine kinase
MLASIKLLIKKFPEDELYQDKIKRLKENIITLRTYTSYFDKAISENITRELEPQELDLVVAKFFKVISLDTGMNKVTVQEPEVNGGDLFTVPMHSSEWATILFNLYTNSLKAIKRADHKEGKIWIRIGKQNGKIYLEFLDNGDGIPEENKERVFEPFFTTSTSASHFAAEEDEVLGTGLGMKIVKDIIDAYGGEIEVVDAHPGYSTNIRIELPEASEIEMENL